MLLPVMMWMVWCGGYCVWLCGLCVGTYVWSPCLDWNCQQNVTGLCSIQQYRIELSEFVCMWSVVSWCGMAGICCLIIMMCMWWSLGSGCRCIGMCDYWLVLCVYQYHTYMHHTNPPPTSCHSHIQIFVHIPHQYHDDVHHTSITPIVDRFK